MCMWADYETKSAFLLPILYCLQNFVRTNQTLINFILALSHVLIDSSVKKKCKSFNNMPLTVPAAEWLERHAGKQGVAGSTPGGNIFILMKSISWYQEMYSEAPFYYLFSINWYQEFDFLISRNHFLISRNIILDIKNRNLFLDIKKSISWYQEIYSSRRFTIY